MDEKIVEVLILYDRKHYASFITKFDFFNSPMEMIGKLRDPHMRIYQFRSIDIEDLDSVDEENAWYEVNTAHIPQPFDARRKAFVDAFNFLWEHGKEVFNNVSI